MRAENRWKKMLGVLAGAAMFAFFLPLGLKAQAADSSVIEKVTVTFRTQYGEPEEIPDPEITVSGNDCTLGDIQFGTDYDRWRPGKKVRVELNIQAENGKIFPVSLTRTQCRVTGANFVSAKATEDDVLQVKVDYVPVTVLGTTDRAGWSSSGKRAVWDSVDYAPGYSLVLYGDDKVVKRLTVKTNSVDLSDYMTDPDKTYYYEVKAIPVTSDERDYLKEGEFVTSTDQDMDWYDWDDDAGDGGSLKGGSYVFPDGSRQVDVWKKLSGSWYYFDTNGNMARGWMAVGGTWYYFNGNGQMQTGWVNPDGRWYYLNPDGAMMTGWQEVTPGYWYYLNPVSDGTRGAMLTGWLFVDGSWFYLDGNGRMATGWLYVPGDAWYYLNPVSDGTRGAMRTGWQMIDGKWYYFGPDGRMAANTVIDGWTVGPDGAWVG